MSNPPAPGIATLEAIWTSNGEVVENTFHYKYTTSITGTMLTALCNTYISWVTSNPGFWSNTSFLTKVEARDLSSTSGASVLVTPASTLGGNLTSPPLPNNVSFALKRITGLRGRANRGRIYLFGLTEQSLGTDGQHISITTASAFATGYNTLMGNQASSNSAQEVILHRALGTGTPVTTYAYADNVFDSQRRRLPLHNKHH